MSNHTTIAIHGDAATVHEEQFARVRFLRSRLSLVLRAYGAYMVMAERAFNRWCVTMSGPEHEQAYHDYLTFSSKAAHMHARHAVLAARILGCAR